ncbi:NAD-dependent epimerase/dehydratase family protein [Nitrosopumilus piranensis]|uniref:NAD-dependent epimerase/dehydratase domain-containing protein n=1 Tax=Nitrosopumilus piranensis TaxID=1582439 RepID=A0A0C5BWB9_9ARCH|nr:NAD(P)-dependent oxidoreductase [Nitrosopumilus piranensis]AJM91275.1 hypothetical protein NPIRD3C_0051 [Nitrosopumilus piranensis]
MARLWISGSSGFIGKHLYNYLKNFYDITCLSHHNNTLLPTTHNHFKLNFQDRSEIDSLISKFGIPDIFIHLGWGDMENPSSSVHLKENVLISKNLIDSFFEHGLQKFIFIGSVEEYGEKNRLLSEHSIPKGTLTNYGKGKYFVANYGLNKQKHSNQSFIHIRLCNSYGSGQRPTSLINYLYNAASTNQKAIVDPGNIFRDCIHISEVIFGIKLLLEQNHSFTVNLGSGKMISLQHFILEFWSQLNQKKENLIFKSNFGFHDSLRDAHVDLSLLYKITHWKPSLSLKDGIRMTLQDMSLK